MSLPEPSPESSPEPRPQTMPEPSHDPPTQAPLVAPLPLLSTPREPEPPGGVLVISTRKEWITFGLGVAAGILSLFTGYIGAIVLLIVFLTTKPPRPMFLRGVGLGLLVLAAVTVGALSICLVVLGAGSVAGY